MSSKKRQREDDTIAENPFSVHLKGNVKWLKKQDDDVQKVLNQLAAFNPAGKFKTARNLDCFYAVEPHKSWNDMPRYNSFILNNIKYSCDSFVYVANPDSIRASDGVGYPPGRGKSRGRAKAKVESDAPARDWVAKIIEIRAKDEHNVFARVCWMYWPDELLEHTTELGEKSTGRQPYHGMAELIASNFVDIINVLSVTQPAQVNHMTEEDDEDTQTALYWRQAYECSTKELSSVKRVCKCQKPANPDKTLVWCNACSKWLHEECIVEDGLKRAHELLTDTSPAAEDNSRTSVKEEDRASTAPDSGNQPTNFRSLNGSVKIEEASRTPTPAVTPRSSIGPSSTLRASTRSVTPSASSARGGKTPSAKVKKESPDLKRNRKLYEVVVTHTPARLKIKDRRPSGGETEWDFPLRCLCCNAVID